MLSQGPKLMTTIQQTTISCPTCQHEVSIEVRNLFDFGSEPNLKERFLQGEFNFFDCFNCGFAKLLDDPFVIYDPSSEQVLFFISDNPQYTPEIMGVIQRDLGNLLAEILTKKPPKFALQPKRVRNTQELINSLTGMEVPTSPTLLDQLLAGLAADERSLLRADLQKCTNPASRQKALMKALLKYLKNILSELERLPETSDTLPRRIWLCRQALNFIDKEDEPETWAKLQNELADSLAQFSQGDATENVERAIRHYKLALEVRTYETMPVKWAVTRINLANTYLKRTEGNRSQNIKQAIQNYTQALQVFTRKSFPQYWANVQSMLANVYLNYKGQENTSSIEQAIIHDQQALTIYTLQEHPKDWVLTQANLANAYSKRIEGDRAENLEQVIYHLKQTLDVYTCQTHSQKWAKIQLNLSTAYSDRIKGNKGENIEQSIHYGEQALRVFTRDKSPLWWARVQNSLASCFLERIKDVRADNIERAITHCHHALEVFTQAKFPQEWAKTQTKLGIAYSNRIKGDRAENIETAIHYHKLALEIHTQREFPIEWARIQTNMAAAFNGRIKGELSENIELAINHSKNALQIHTRQEFPRDWALIQNNLANHYFLRVIGDTKKNLELSIHHCKEALQVFTRQTAPQNWALSQRNIAAAYSKRLEGNRADNLEEAIKHNRRAFEVYTKEEHPQDWSVIQSNLSAIYVERIKGERLDNLEQAIHHAHQALQVLTRENNPQDWGRLQANLANAFTRRLTGTRADNQEQAIEHYQQSIQVLTLEDFPQDWAQVQINLANIFVGRIFGERAENIEQAIKHCRNALRVYTHQSLPQGWARIQEMLASAYLNRVYENRSRNIELAIEHYQQALNVYTKETLPQDWAINQYNLALTYADRTKGQAAKNYKQAVHHFRQALQVQTRKQFPADYQRTNRIMGNIYFKEQEWDSAHNVYQNAIDAEKDLFRESYTEAGRYIEIIETAKIYSNISYTLLKLDQPAKALEQLEQGKTRLLNQTLALNEVDLSLLPPPQQEAIHTLRQTIHELDSEMRLPINTPARRDERIVAQKLEKARRQLNKTIEAIQAENPDFMPTGLDLPDILNLIPEGGALVAPLVTTQGGAVFVISSGATSVSPADVIWLDEFTDEFLQILLLGSEDEEGWLQSDTRDSHQRWQGAFENVTSRLWSTLLEPIHRRLATLGLAEGDPVLLMPQGGLGLLPLHAAWCEVDGIKRAFLDDYTITYAPSAYAFSISQRRIQEERRHRLSLLGIVNPTSDLPFTPFEGTSIAGLFDAPMRQVLLENQATKDTATQAIPNYAYLHFACHGFYDWQNAMQSGLWLSNKTPLTLGEIISTLDLSATRLVVLSACETGLTEFQQSPDEYIGLPAGFLQAGAPAVISTLWKVDDLSTALFMQQFYQYHLQDNLSPTIALRQAQLWLRDEATLDRIVTYINDYMETIRVTYPLTYLTTKTRLNTLLEEHNHNFNTRPFAHPYHWAAFTFTGN